MSVTQQTSVAPHVVTLDVPLPASPPPPSAAAGGRDQTVQRAVALSLASLAILLIGFVIFLRFISALQFDHSQLVSYDSFRSQLDGATAPVGPVSPGTSVALLDIPEIGLHHVVVVQGTSAENLTHGPGLRSDTPLPGEAGVSVIYGRRSTFGGVFGRIGSLKVGDIITTTTGHGVAHYKVTGFSFRGQPVHDTDANRLVLVTANSSIDPQYANTVSAELTTTPVADDGGYPSVGGVDQELAGDPSGTLLLMVWCLALVGVAAAGTTASLYWSRWPAWLLTAPVALAVVWNIYENAAHLLPNLL